MAAKRELQLYLADSVFPFIEDGKTLYLCARSGLYKIGLNIPGIRP